MSSPPDLPPLLYEDLLRAALHEDLGAAGDLTSDAIVGEGKRTAAHIVARMPGRLAGIGVAAHVFRLLDGHVEVVLDYRDGDDFDAGQLATVTGKARALLAAERTALNLLGRMCGIATATRDAVAEIAGTKARIVCTRNLEQLDPIGFGHPEIGDQKIVATLDQRLGSPRALLEQHQFDVRQVTKGVRDHLQDPVLIIDHEHASANHSAISLG